MLFKSFKARQAFPQKSSHLHTTKDALSSSSAGKKVPFLIKQKL